jgi:hypothetical protein
MREIFEYLTPVQSTCLGLSCKSMHVFHKAQYSDTIYLHEVDFYTSTAVNRQLSPYCQGDYDFGRQRKHFIQKTVKQGNETTITSAPVVFLGELLWKWVGPNLRFHWLVEEDYNDFGVKDSMVIRTVLMNGRFRKGKARETHIHQMEMLKLQENAPG